MIAIEGIDMPKECYRCPLLDGKYGTCNIIGETKVDMTEERAKNCPLIEIVTCKDCIHRDEYGCRHGHPNCKDNFYCADAERKE